MWLSTETELGSHPPPYNSGAKVAAASTLAAIPREGFEDIFLPPGARSRSPSHQTSGDVPSRHDRTTQRAARALNSFEGAGALDVHVRSVSSLGLGELNLEGKYEEKLKVGVMTTFYQARWGDVLLRDRATLTSRSEYMQAERYYSEKIHGMSTRDRSLYRLLIEKVRTLVPRFPERAR